MTHIELKTIHGDTWIMHKDNIKNVSLVDTPSAFIEQWNHDKVVIITSTEINPDDSKPWQFMVSNPYNEIKDELCGVEYIEIEHQLNNVKKEKAI